MAVTKLEDMLELRKAGLDALNAALGQDKAQAFLKYWGRTGSGDFTKERHERPSRTHEEIMADIRRIEKEYVAAGGRFTTREKLDAVAV
jgi:hypothetical protein